ncbi:MAG TPA: hypothetical protein VJ810_12540 [Blastocatellia bacterium]|nr:hypothetical protein [Blastocatellia bacterium]
MKPNPLIPLVMHTIARGVSGIDLSNQSELDKKFARSLQSIEPRLREKVIGRLKELIATYNSIPSTVKQRFVSQELAQLKAEQPLSRETLSRVVSPTVLQSFGRGLVVLSPAPKAPPHIDEIQPSSNLKPGMQVTLLGSGFASAAKKNVVKLFQKVTPDPDSPSKFEFVADLEPIETAGQNASKKLSVILPKNLVKGRIHSFKVILKDDLSAVSNEIQFDLLSEPMQNAILEPPKIQIADTSQQPNKKLFFSGKNIGLATVLKKGNMGVGDKAQLPYTLKATLHSEDNDLPDVWLGGLKILVNSPKGGDGQGEILLPMNLNPGAYMLQFTATTDNVFVNFDGTGMTWHSQLIPIVILPYKYKVEFTQLTCVDESNELSPSDEAMAIWAVTADGFGSQPKMSQEMSDFDGGETHAFTVADRPVFRFDNTAGPISAGLSLVTELWEVDDIDGVVAAFHAIKTVCEAVAIAAAPFNVVVAAIAGAGSKIADAAAAIAELIGNESDFLGIQTLLWTATQLQTQTNNPNKQFSGQLAFINSDSTGSWRADFVVTRFD